ncbi:hypothetical protein GCM10012288_05800 [Malaciobacter pacificus]|uniref:SPOR domain-containing protein n=1 Tax=Malaciobacter pacificus TaxID=1080223 RepID=A0A5C2H522_9BACT|nr:SPOR domain-containing protein [Malaciobacter pacificus]QEP33893.1 SPOR domain-containing protein [Malaciobacter pacificus]GGD34689.1 hypothetical protein GCM10012288_05800 [Malaciobacter pacificus]
MQIKGEEFIKKVQLQQEREELEQKLNELEEAEQTYTEEDPVIVETPISNEHELNNIMLDANEPINNDNDNKKKYLALGIVLVVLFLLTIIIIRLLTGDEKEDDFTSSKASSLEMKKLEENSNIEENFQKIINERIKKEAETVANTDTKSSEDKIDNIEQNIQEEEKEKTLQSTLDETIKKIEEKTKEIQKTEEKAVKTKPEVKEEPKKSIKDLVQSTASNEVISGYFVQIGAFTKTPSSSYINKIRDAGLKYKVYKVEVKGTMYNKVLIGPYSSRAVAKDNIDSIKKKLNLSSAYVLKF